MLLMAGVLYPFVTGVTWAFSHIGFDGVARFTGLANFFDLFEPGHEGLQGLSTTLRYAFAAVAMQTVLGLSVALLLTWKARWIRVFQTLVIVPMLLPPVVATVMWKVMMVDRGVLDYFAQSLGLESVNWLGSPGSAFWSVLMIETWIYTPFVTLLLLAGLHGIPEEILEAAKVDGAGFFSQLRHIYLPLLRPYFVLVLVFRGIDSLKSFEVIWTATQGGPLNTLRTLHIYAYQFAIQYLDFGRSMTFLFVLWILTYGLSFLLLKARRQAAVA
jgi:multiple sugar transport system permease protein